MLYHLAVSLWGSDRVFRVENIAVHSLTSVFYVLTALLKGKTEILHSWVTGTSYRNPLKNNIKALCWFIRKTLQGLLYSSLSNLISLTFYLQQFLLRAWFGRAYRIVQGSLWINLPPHNEALWNSPTWQPPTKWENKLKCISISHNIICLCSCLIHLTLVEHTLI